MAELSANVRMIKGIGEQRAKALGKLGIVTLRDLIGWFPRRYEDRRTDVHEKQGTVRAESRFSI